MEQQYLWGLNAESWTAIATFIIAIGTLALGGVTALLVFVAYRQIRAARWENRKTQTLLACGQYDTNSLLYHCIKRIRAAQENNALKSEPKKYRREIITLLNFLDAIAIGIQQNLYIEGLAYDHLDGIIRTHVSELIDSGITDAAGCPRINWQRLVDLRDKWARATPHFKDED